MTVSLQMLSNIHLFSPKESSFWSKNNNNAICLYSLKEMSEFWRKVSLSTPCTLLYGNIKVEIGISLVIYPFSDLLDSVCTILWHLSPENGHLNEWSGTSLLQNILGQSIDMQYIGEVGIKQLVVNLIMKQV